MLPLGVFRERQFAATNAVTFIVYAALTGATFLLPVQLQVVSGYSPLASGLALLPLTLIMLALSARSGRLATRIGPRLQMSSGPVIVGAGLALLVFSNYGSSYVVCVLPAVVVFGLGRAVTVAPLTATAMSSAPTEHSGIASAVNNDVARWAAWPGPSMGERSEWSSEPIGPPVHQPTRLPPGPAASERSLCATAAAETPHSQSRPDRRFTCVTQLIRQRHSVTGRRRHCAAPVGGGHPPARPPGDRRFCRTVVICLPGSGPLPRTP